MRDFTKTLKIKVSALVPRFYPSVLPWAVSHPQTPARAGTFAFKVM